MVAAAVLLLLGLLLLGLLGEHEHCHDCLFEWRLTILLNDEEHERKLRGMFQGGIEKGVPEQAARPFPVRPGHGHVKHMVSATTKRARLLEQRTLEKT